MTFFSSICYGYLSDFDNELDRENQKFKQSLQGLYGQEKREAILDKQLEYEIRILEKQRSIYALNKKKDTMSQQEIREQTKNIQNEINSLRRAQSKLI